METPRVASTLPSGHLGVPKAIPGMVVDHSDRLHPSLGISKAIPGMNVAPANRLHERVAYRQTVMLLALIPVLS